MLPCYHFYRNLRLLPTHLEVAVKVNCACPINCIHSHLTSFVAVECARPLTWQPKFRDPSPIYNKPGPRASVTSYLFGQSILDQDRCVRHYLSLFYLPAFVSTSRSTLDYQFNSGTDGQKLRLSFCFLRQLFEALLSRCFRVR